MLRPMSRVIAIAAFGSIFAFGDPALSKSCIDVSLPDSMSAAGSTLALNGMGIRKATILKVKVYVAGLYLAEQSNDAKAILGAARPWRLELHFVHDVSAADMEQAFREGFAASGNAASPASVNALMKTLVDFKSGHELGFTAQPSKGVTVDIDGAGKGTISGNDFASALLAIWLGPKPPNKDLKTGLLGGKCA